MSLSAAGRSGPTTSRLATALAAPCAVSNCRPRRGSRQVDTAGPGAYRRATALPRSRQEEAMKAGRMLSRRHVVGSLSLAGVGALLPSLTVTAAEDRLETTTIRLVQDPSTCVAPEYVVEDLLRAEGFREI